MVDKHKEKMDAREEAEAEEVERLKIEEAMDKEPEEIKNAFKKVAADNKAVLKTIGKTLEDQLNKKQQLLKERNRHEMAITVLEMGTIENMTTDTQATQFENYLKDKADRREKENSDRADERTKNIIMRSIQFTFLMIAYVVGGMPFVLQLMAKVFGG